MRISQVVRMIGHISPLFVLVTIVLIWGVSVEAFDTPRYLFPHPKDILQEFVDRPQYLWRHFIVTLREAMVGFLLAFGIAFGLSIILALFDSVEKFVVPYVIAVQAVPIVAIAPLLVLWLGPDVESKVAMAAIICFPPMAINFSRGIRAASVEHLRLFAVYQTGRWRLFWKLKLPSGLAFYLSGMRVSAALAMIGAIVAEYAGASAGLGYTIMQASYRLDTPLLFASVICSAAGGWLMFGVIVGCEHVLGRLHYGPRRSE